jgi:hypothetical protein
MPSRAIAPRIGVAFMGQRWVLGVLVALGVAGCGGTDPAEGSLSASAVACTVAENSNSCSIAVTWTSQHAADLSLQAMPEGARQVTTAGTAPVSVTVRGTTVVLASGGLALATLSLTATCAGETEADEMGYCLAKQLRYTDKVYAEYNYPRVVTAERATRIANRTRYPDDQYRIDNCRLKPAPDPSGRIGVSCAVTAVANGRPSASSITRKFYIDPVADVLRDGDEGEPAAGDYGPGTRPAVPPISRPTTGRQHSSTCVSSLSQACSSCWTTRRTPTGPALRADTS